MASQLFLTDIVDDDSQFDPIHVTFSGGAKDPFCRWYPYLEGYSPEFVRTVLRQYGSEASSVLDPFGGTATTAFTASEERLASYICEVNPVMQFIFEAKTSVRTLAGRARTEVADSIAGLADQFTALCDACAADEELRRTYTASFGKSAFFPEGAIERVLRTRTLVDELSETSPLAARLLTVAVLAALVPASLLKRAGDVRYMTPQEISKGIPAFQELVIANLRAIAHDIGDVHRQLFTRPLLLCGDARELRSLPAVGVDCVVTSPPYINGTNYFRNTKLELWFLRCLRSGDDLRYYREKAVTGGINDVTVAKSSAAHTEEVAKVVERLSANAYDARIPLMVASYFAEITDVFQSVSTHLNRGATIAIDIGDSNYNGVHVPADKLIVNCLEQVGYRFQQDIELRKRRSKNGAPLRQALLIMEWPRVRKAATRSSNESWRDKWNSFTNNLPHQQAPYSARNWGSGLHSLCSYPGKLKPSIAHHLIDTFVPKNGTMLDPFAGVGTIPFEAAMQGRHSFGMDLSPAAYAVAAAKLSINQASDTATVLERVGEYVAAYSPNDSELAEVRAFGMNGKIVEFYQADTLREVLALRQYFLELREPTPSELLVKAACLHLLHGNRPYAFSRRSHPLTPYAPTGEVEYRPVMPRLLEKVERSLSEPLPTDFVTGKVFHQDCTAWWPSEVRDLDAVITSPPFFDSTRFHVQNWLRLWFTGWTPEVFKSKPKLFVDERQKQDFAVYEAILRQSKERLRPGGVVVWHLGKSVKCDMADALAKVGSRWFTHSELFDESVAHCESHGLRDKGTVTSHQYLVMY